MRKFNLLGEIPSVRNTLRPDGSFDGEETRVPLRVFVLSGIMAGLAAAYWLGPPVWLDKTRPAASPVIKQQAAVKPAAPPVSPAGETKEPKAPPEQKKIEEPGAVAMTAPDEIVTRPVAKDAKPAGAKTGAKSAGGWRVRFALCLYSKSCAVMAARLSQKGIEAQMTENPSEITFFKVIAGPWPAISQALEAADALAAKGLEAAPFSANEMFYVGVPSLTTAAGRDMAVKICGSLGYNVETAPPRKEKRRVFKVYAKGSFADKEGAEKAACLFKGRGIECVVEKEG